MKDEDVRIPCELCNMLVKVADFQAHVERHGVSLVDGQATGWLRGKASPHLDLLSYSSEATPGGAVVGPNLAAMAAEMTVEPPKAPGFGGLARKATVIALPGGPALGNFRMLDDAAKARHSTAPLPPGVEPAEPAAAAAGAAASFAAGAVQVDPLGINAQSLGAAAAQPKKVNLKAKARRGRRL